jgi:hypothetical protein
MPIPGFAARRDANEQEIIEALEAAGASVKQLSMKGVCDLLVGIADIETGEQRNYLIEVKAPDGKLTDDQFEFFETWRGQCEVARTIEEALAIIKR